MKKELKEYLTEYDKGYDAGYEHAIKQIMRILRLMSKKNKPILKKGFGRSYGY